MAGGIRTAFSAAPATFPFHRRPSDEDQHPRARPDPLSSLLHPRRPTNRRNPADGRHHHFSLLTNRDRRRDCQERSRDLADVPPEDPPSRSLRQTASRPPRRNG